MNTAPDTIDEHHLVKNAQRKFTILFGELQKMRQADDSSEFEEFIFLLETQLITLYYQRIKQNLEIIASSEPKILHFTDKKEVSTMATERLMQVLTKFKHKDLSSLLKCTTLPISEK